MELQTISQVSKQFNISTRTLRYYEQIGLIQSLKKDDFSYRMYDEHTITILKQIIILRKLRIPLKQIAEMLCNEDTAAAIEVFRKNLNEIDDEITALSTIKNVIQTFIDRLSINNSKLRLLDDESILKIIDSLTITKVNFKEEKEKSMEELNKANERLGKLTDKDVRIVCLPPATVAAYQYEGNDPECHTIPVIDKFVRDNDLVRIKPDLRHYGFNSPDYVDNTGITDMRFG